MDVVRQEEDAHNFNLIMTLESFHFVHLSHAPLRNLW